MPQEEQHDQSLGDGLDQGGDFELLPTISLTHLRHEKIPNLYQCCYEYVEPWQWSSEAELVETGRWVGGPLKDNC